jgi:TolB-like protein/tRNA A-37 threonylcarbamoyl transferase component Bud32/Tfp pilus assembly protein PilF
MTPEATPPSQGGVGQQIPSSSSEAERWARIKALFLQAFDYEEVDRSAFLDEACAGDLELRREVESLLVSEAATTSFCEVPAAGLLRVSLDAPPVPHLQPGTRLGAYEVTGFIAAGGMGEVYRARHTVLGREVAVKTLGSRTGDEAAARRLIREARHASNLSHPNICTIHEVGEAADGPFIVMEYVAGRPLGDLIRDERPSLPDAITCGIQIADALAHAHQRGIVHRDLKSSNIIVAAGGRPVVLDFGLARRLNAENELQARVSTLTANDALAGTLSHMAPEVLLGGPPDVRSDVWALGVVLYELMTGDLPFPGVTAFQTSSAILESRPQPLSGRIPLALRLVIERCLMKDPHARYQSASEVRAALDAIRRRRAWPLVGPLLISVHRRSMRVLAALMLLIPLLLVAAPRLIAMLGGSGARVSTMVVLPIENGTGQPQALFYADGLTDGLIAQLGALTDVRIIPRASAVRLAGMSASRAQIARQLGVDVMVQGTLRHADERVTIDFKLIDPARGRVFWSETLERDAREALALQSDAVRALALALRLAVRPEASDRLALVRAISPAAYEAYLKGRYEWNQRTPESLQRAITHYTRSVELDPTYAPAHAALADCYNQLATVMVSSGSPREWRPRAAAEAIKALQLDAYSAEAHATLGYVRHYQWQWSEAEQEFRRAIELNPSFSLARIWYANLLMSRNRMDEALEQVFAARDLDPFSLAVNTNVAWALTYAGRYEEAIAQLERTLELDSMYAQAHQRLADALRGAGRTAEAVETARRVVALTNRNPYSLARLATSHAQAGQIAEARIILRELLARAEREYVPPWSFVHAYVALGDIESAATWTEKAFEEGSNGIAYLTPDPDLAPLRRHPRIRALMARVGLE